MKGFSGSPEGIRIQILTGALAGENRSFAGPSVTLGRNPGSDLRFDQLADLAVSGRHATISLLDGRWLLEDLGSLNGTLLNGRRILGPTPLEHEDRIQFGDEGPLVSFHILVSGASSSHYGSPRSHRGLLAWVAFLSLALIFVGTLAVRSWKRETDYARQVRAMQSRIDSILFASETTVQELQGRNQGLAEALNRSRQDIQGLRQELESAQLRGNQEEIETLRFQLQQSQSALMLQQLAAGLDYEAIEEANAMAVVKVFIDFGDEVTTASAFSIRSDGVLLTNRHVVAGPAGAQRPERIAVQFAGSRQIWPARVVAVSQTYDLAALKVDNIIGEVPVVSGLNQQIDTVRSGQAVAVMGFPLGGVDPTVEGQNGVARITLTAGIISDVSEEELVLRGYGVEGSSGSPVFDGTGKAIGVLYGGRIEAGERILFAVPASKVEDLLSRIF